MKLLKKVVYTVCSGELEKECDNFIQQKRLPEFKRNCPACGSKTKGVLGANHVGIASILVLFLIAAGGAYWQIHRVRSTAIDLVQQATSQAVSAIDGTQKKERAAETSTDQALLRELEKLNQNGDVVGVQRRGEEYLASNPKDTTVLINVAAAALRQGKIEVARGYLKRAVDLKPNDYIVRYNLGCVEARSGNKDEAVNHLKKACQLGLAPASFRQDPDLASLAGYASFEDLVVNKKCQ